MKISIFSADIVVDFHGFYMRNAGKRASMSLATKTKHHVAICRDFFTKDVDINVDILPHKKTSPKNKTLVYRCYSPPDTGEIFFQNVDDSFHSNQSGDAVNRSARSDHSNSHRSARSDHRSARSDVKSDISSNTEGAELKKFAQYLLSKENEAPVSASYAEEEMARLPEVLFYEFVLEEVQ